MKSAIVENGVVTNVIVGEIEGSIACGDDVAIGWTYDGKEFAAPPPPPPPLAPLSDYQAAIQSTVDAAAAAKQFNDGVTLASYVSSTIAAWAAQATAFVAWRDQVWTYAYTELAKVEAGTRQQPTVAQFLTELPTITWPAN